MSALLLYADALHPVSGGEKGHPDILMSAFWVPALCYAFYIAAPGVDGDVAGYGHVV